MRAWSFSSQRYNKTDCPPRGAWEVKLCRVILNTRGIYSTFTVIPNRWKLPVRGSRVKAFMSSSGKPWNILLVGASAQEIGVIDRYKHTLYWHQVLHLSTCSVLKMSASKKVNLWYNDTDIDKTKTWSYYLGLGWGASLCSLLWSSPADFLQPPAPSGAACPCMFPRWGRNPLHHWPETNKQTNKQTESTLRKLPRAETRAASLGSVCDKKQFSTKSVALVQKSIWQISCEIF